MITIDKVDTAILNQETGVYSFDLNTYLDGKEVTGRNNIIAKIKSEDAEILTSEVKLGKNSKVEFKNPKETTVIYIDIENQDAYVVNLSFTSNEIKEELSETNVNETSLEVKELDIQDNTTDKDETLKVDEESKYPILKDTSNVEFSYIFTSQIKEILSKDENISNEALEIYNKAISTTNKIVFYRDTNTNLYYWISKDIILSNSDFVQLLIDVNEHNSK